MRILCTLIAICLSAQIFASVESFEKRFELVRDQDGTLIQIKDRNFVEDVRLSRYLSFIKERIEEALQNESFGRSTDAKSDYVMGLMTSHEEESSRAELDLEWMRPYVKGSIEAFEVHNLGRILRNRKVKEVFNKFEAQLNREWVLLGLGIIARPGDAQFFYKRNVGYQVVTMGLNLAKSMLGEIPLLNIASQMIVEYERAVRERRLYHQNMFLHFAENYAADELGMTDKEMDHVVSSIYEARIQWFNYFESEKAVELWDRYGFDKFYARIRQANQLLIMRPDIFETLGTRINYAFQDATSKDRKVIYNLFDSAHQFTSMPAISYYYEQPNRIKMERSLMELVKAGLGLITIPDFAKTLITGHIDSMYKKQRLTEGGLMAHLEEVENHSLKRRIHAQNLNPFIR